MRADRHQLSLAAALELGITRRAGDLRALQPTWEPAQQALVVHPADLCTLIPLTEIAVAAARIGHAHHRHSQQARCQEPA